MGVQNARARKKAKEEALLRREHGGEEGDLNKNVF